MGRPKHSRIVIAVLHYALTRLPLNAAYAVMAFILSKSGENLVKARNIRTNIRDIYPNLGEPEVHSLAQKILANFGRHITEIFRIASFRDGKNGMRINVSTPEGLSFSGTGPAIYVGAHVGSWELLPVAFTQKNQPITVIYSENDNAMLNDLLMHQRAQTGATYVEKNTALRPCFQALSRGEAVAFLVDQRVNPGLDVRFFGRPTTISRMPARLAENFDCPVIPFEVVRLGPGHLCINFQTPIYPTGQKGKDAEFQLTQKIATSVENSIKRNTETWFCAKLRWKRADREKHSLPKRVSD